MRELRQRMIRAMELGNLSKNTQRAYLSAVSGLARHYMQSPDKMTKAMVEDYLVYLKKERGQASNSRGVVVCALRFFCRHVLCDEETPPGFGFRRKPRKLPTVLTQAQVWRIINATDNTKHRFLLTATYSAGLRAREVIALKPEHIDTRMLITVEDGKGGKERYTLLSERLLKELRQHYRTFRPKKWLFPSPHTGEPLCYESVRSVYEDARRKAGFKRGQASTPFDMALPPTFWRPATISTRYRSSWVTDRCPPL